MSNKLLEVMNLVTQFYNHGQSYPVVDHVSFSVAEGEVFGIVGESGCGKSVTFAVPSSVRSMLWGLISL